MGDRLRLPPFTLNLKGSFMRVAAVVMLSVLFAACSKSSSSNPVTPPTSDVSFSSQVQPILSANCATSGCHAGSSPQQGMDLSTGKAYSNIVNVLSIEIPTYYRVKPSYSDSSFLYFKITGNSIAGARMPYQRASLSTSDIQTIKDWIDQGAKNN